MEIRELLWLLPAEDLIVSLSIYLLKHSYNKTSLFLSYIVHILCLCSTTGWMFRTLAIICLYICIQCIMNALGKMCTLHCSLCRLNPFLKFINISLLLQIIFFFSYIKEKGNTFTSHCGPVSKGRIFSRTSRVPMSASDPC